MPGEFRIYARVDLSGPMNPGHILKSFCDQDLLKKYIGSVEKSEVDQWLDSGRTIYGNGEP